MATSTAQGTTTQTIQQTQTSVQDSVTAYRYLVAWLLVIVVLVLLNQTKLGHTVIYYTLVLCIVFLLLTQYHAIAAILAPISQPGAPGGAASGGGGAGGGF